MLAPAMQELSLVAKVVGKHNDGIDRQQAYNLTDDVAQVFEAPLQKKKLAAPLILPSVLVVCDSHEIPHREKAKGQ